MAHSYKSFVCVGNAKQNFSRLLEAIENQIELLPKPIFVQSGHTPFSSENCTVVDFISMDSFAKYLSEAEVLILHAGAGSVLHAIKANKKPIIMPRTARFNEHVNDHQVAFSKVLHDEGKAIMVESSDELRSAILTLKQNINVDFANNDKSLAFDQIRKILHQILSE